MQTVHFIYKYYYAQKILLDQWEKNIQLNNNFL